MSLTRFVVHLMALASLFFAFALISFPARAEVETVTHIHNDAFGNPVLATDASGNVVWRESYRPYGERLKNEPASAPSKQWFAGKPQDTETGLSYFGARYYDPVIGRFMGIDPQGFEEKNPQSFNRYAYGNNNPYKFIDPDGRVALPFAIVVVGGAVIVGGGYYANQTGQRQNEGLVPPRVEGGVPGFSAGALQGLGDAVRDPGGFMSWVGGKLDSLIFSEGRRLFSDRERRDLLDRSKDQDGVPRCVYCGQELNVNSGSANSFEADHRKAHSKGGETNLENGAAACRTCNREKSNKEAGVDWIPPNAR